MACANYSVSHLFINTLPYRASSYYTTPSGKMISKYKLTCSADRLSGITRHHYRHDFFDETTCSCNISLAGNTQDIECIYLYDSGFALEWLRRSH